MNRNPAALNAMVIGGSVLGGLMILFVMLMNGGNVLGQFFKFTLGGLFALGLFFPRQGVYVLLASCAYFDLLKRLLVVADRVTYSDLTYVLGCPPALLGGVFLGVIMQMVHGRHVIRGWNWFCLMAAPLICGAVYLGCKHGGTGNKDAFTDAINGGFYSVLLIAVPLLFPTGTELRRLLRFTVWAYLPVAIYGIWQKTFGLMDFEIAYLKTGLTVLIGHLVMGELKPFSTLNSPTALGAVCTTLAVFCFLAQWHAPPQERRGIRKTLYAILGILYVGGWIASTSRSDGIILLAALTAAPLFLGRIKTGLLYCASGAAFVALVLASESILQNLERLQYFLWSFTGQTDGQFFDQMTRLGTYSDRLMGFSALTNDSRVWTLFGASQMVQETVHFHDPLTSLLLNLGVVPLTIGLALCVWMISRIHRRVWNIEDMADRRLACMCLATAVGLVAVSLLAGNRLNVFPVGVHFWLLVSMTTALGWNEVRNPLSEKPEEAPAQTAPSPARPRGGRFRPTRHLPFPANPT